MSSFGPVFAVEPRAGHAHSHTAVLLHGRGSTGEQFAEELLEMSLSERGPGLADRLPSWRWVFPTAPSTWNTTFEEWMPAWFEAPSLADPAAGQDLQQPGLQASAQHVSSVIEAEIGRLGRADAHSRVVVGGISLGGAVALWTLLGTRRPDRPLGGLIALSTWLPFAAEAETCLAQTHTAADAAAADTATAAVVFARRMMEPLQGHLRSRQDGDNHQPPASVLATPVLVGHGRDDAYVSVDLGRQARQLLTRAGFAVGWREYEGAEQEGHWLKEPEETDDVALFLEGVM